MTSLSGVQGRYTQPENKGSVGMMMNTMLKESAFSQEEIEELYEILRKGK